MPFPVVDRVIYRKNPLDQVICQLRFPPILKIDAEIPSGFQDAVRADFPNYSEKAEINLALPQGNSETIAPDALQRMLQASAGKNHEFASEDGLWKINLTRNFVALTSNKYERWEQFKDRLQLPLRALIDNYSPPYFSRLGLRYINVVRRSALGLQDIFWIELIQPYILGILAAPNISDHITAFENSHEIQLSDSESTVRLITRYVKAVDNDELCFMIDNDFYSTKKSGIEATLDKLDFLGVRGSRLFQWCITKRLHDALEPQPL